MSYADFCGGQVWLFVNNPHVKANGAKWHNDTGQLPSYDVLTASNIGNYSVQRNARSIGAGDWGVVYRVDGAQEALSSTKGDSSKSRPRRHFGHIVAFAHVTSSPWTGGDGGSYVNWHLIRLAPENWISWREMEASGHWDGKTPFGANHQATTPVRQSREQWDWLESAFEQHGLHDVTSMFRSRIEGLSNPAAS